MALHGTVEVNRQEIYEWVAVRQLEGPDGMNTYEVRLYAPSAANCLVAETTMRHAYNDGALVLASKVLAWAAGEA